MPHLQLVESRHRHLRHVGFLGLLIPRLVPSLLPLREEPGPGLLSFADKEDIDEVAEVVFRHSDHGPADHGEHPAPFQIGQDLLHPVPLDAHAGGADDVGAGAALEVDGLNVLIDQGDVVPSRSQGGQQWQASDRRGGALAHERQDQLHAPERDVEPWVDDDDVSHEWACSWCGMPPRTERPRDSGGQCGALCRKDAGGRSSPHLTSNYYAAQRRSSSQNRKPRDSCDVTLRRLDLPCALRSNWTRSVRPGTQRWDEVADLWFRDG